MTTVSILGCGWYGLALAKDLIKEGITVKGSTTSPDKAAALSREGIQPYIIDLGKDHAPDNTFFECDVLVIAIPPKSRLGQGDTYVPKLQRAISGIIASQVKKVVLIGSTGIYADLNMEVNELTDPRPVAISGKILSEAEELFKQQETFKTTIIRFGGLLGPGREPGRFFSGRIGIPNGLAPVNLIHLDDCTGITRAIIRQDAFGYTFNACTPHHPKKMDFYTKAAVKAGLHAPEFLPELKEWKIVCSVNVETVLGYKYMISNWDEWLG